MKADTMTSRSWLHQLLNPAPKPSPRPPLLPEDYDAILASGQARWSQMNLVGFSAKALENLNEAVMRQEMAIRHNYWPAIFDAPSLNRWRADTLDGFLAEIEAGDLRFTEAMPWPVAGPSVAANVTPFKRTAK